MKLIHKYQSDYEKIIKENNPNKLIHLVEQHQRESNSDDFIQIILALASLLEDDNMQEYVKSGLFIPVLKRLIKETASLIEID